MLAISKASLREEALAEINAMDVSLRKQADAKLEEILKDQIDRFSGSWKIQYGHFPYIGLYTPLPTEPKCFSDKNFWSNLSTALPFRKSDGGMGYAKWSFSNDIPGNAYFLEKNNLDEIDPDLVLVPGLCFNRKGLRIGRGKGYFDLFFKSHHCVRVGVAYSKQIKSKLLEEDHDEKMNMIITEKEIIEVNKNEFFI